MQKIVSYSVVLIVFVWAGVSTYLLNVSPIEDRIKALFSGNPLVLSTLQYTETINNPLNGYNARVYLFDFPSYATNIDCKIISSSLFLKKPFFADGGILYGAVKLIPYNSSLCVKYISKKNIEEIIITHKNGLLYFISF
jgi:hypothetical protein